MAQEQSLSDHLRALIEAEGPIPLDRYMAEALLHPDWGYYTRRDPLGRAGDFITAPEISQMFGELIGLWLADCWAAQGTPNPVRLVELGPGRGTLMADLLRAAGRASGFAEAASVHLVEASPALREKQAERVPEAQWHDALADVPAGPLFLVANEFFDALPVRQFQRAANGWCERCIGLDGDRLAFTTTAPSGAPDLPEARLAKVPEGGVVEVSSAASQLVAEIAVRVTGEGGAALIVDYGYGRGETGDTFQAVRDHEPVDPLAAPGEADLTCHVDFAALKAAADEAGAEAYGPVGQGRFLKALGIEARAMRLMSGAGLKGSRDVPVALRRLTAPEEMGKLFKALAILPPTAPPAAGFAP